MPDIVGAGKSLWDGAQQVAGYIDINKILSDLFTGIFNWMEGLFASVIIYLAKLIYFLVIAFATPLLEAASDMGSLFDTFNYIFSDGDGGLDLYTTVRIMAFAILTLVSAFQIFKSMNSHLGFETDEPWKIGIRILVFGFLTYYSLDLCKMIIDIYQSLLNSLILQNPLNKIQTNFSKIAWPGDTFKGVSTENFEIGKEKSIIGAIAYAGATIYVSVKILMLVLRFFERRVIAVMLILLSPLAFISGISKSTKVYLHGWVKAFTGNLFLQIFQYIVFIIIAKIMSDQYAKSSQGALTFQLDKAYLIYIVTVVSFAKVLDKLEEMIRDAGLSVGAMSGPLGGLSELGNKKWGLNSAGGLFGGGQEGPRNAPK